MKTQGGYQAEAGPLPPPPVEKRAPRTIRQAATGTDIAAIYAAAYGGSKMNGQRDISAAESAESAVRSFITLLDSPVS